MKKQIFLGLLWSASIIAAQPDIQEFIVPGAELPAEWEEQPEEYEMGSPVEVLEDPADLQQSITAFDEDTLLPQDYLVEDDIVIVPEGVFIPSDENTGGWKRDLRELIQRERETYNRYVKEGHKLNYLKDTAASAYYNHLLPAYKRVKNKK